jgi:integrase
MQVKSLIQRARRYGLPKREESPEIRQVSIYNLNTYEKVRSVGMSFARWLSERRGTPVFRMVEVKARDVDEYVRYRKEVYERGLVTAATLQADISALKKIEAMVNYRYGKVEWGIPAERGGRREKWGLPRRERGKNAPQRGPAYTRRQADRIVEEVEARCGRVAADALRFCRATGCRLESLVDLGEKGVRAARINAKDRTVTLLEKGGKWRTVQYDSRYQEFMEGLAARAQGDYREKHLFAGLGRSSEIPGRERLIPEQMWEEKKRAARYLHRAVKEAAEKEGFTGRGLHGFRKEFAVRRHAEYLREVRSLVQLKDWRGLSEKFGVSERKAKDLVAGWAKAGSDTKERHRLAREMDAVARMNLSKDLGHNRLDVTYAYVPRKKY